MGDQNVRPEIVLKAEIVDKENRDNIVNIVNASDRKDDKDKLDNLVAKLHDKDNLVAKLQEENAQQHARIAEQATKLSQSEVVAVQLREAMALHERLRLDLEESRRRAKQSEATQLQLQEENRLHLEARENLQRERKDWKERCSSLEAQNADLGQRLCLSENHQVDIERSIAAAEKEKRAEVVAKDVQLQEMQRSLQVSLREKDMQLQEMQRSLREKDIQLQDVQQSMRDKDSSLEEMQVAARGKDLRLEQMQESAQVKDHRLREMECLVHDKDIQLQGLQQSILEKDHRLREMECLVHDKDQSLQQLKHEQQQRDSTFQAQLHEVQSDLARATATAKVRVDEKALTHLKQKIQEQKTVIESLESQLRRQACVASLATPGEFSRLCKSSEAKNGLTVEHSTLVRRNNDLETEAAIMRKEIYLLHKRLPLELCEELSREAAASVVEEELLQDEASMPCSEPTSQEPGQEPSLSAPVTPVM